MTTIEEHTRRAVELATRNVAAGQFPFAALVVSDGGEGEVIGTGLNTCRRDADPSSHGEVEAIRDACRRLGTFDLTGAVIASSCHPCPICQALAGATGVARIYYAATREQAAAGGFGMPGADGAAVAERIDGLLIPIEAVDVDCAAEPFDAWLASGNGYETAARPVHELRVALTAADHGAAVRFYGYTLGMPRIADWTSPDGKVVVLDGGRATLELIDEAQADYIDSVEVGRRVAGPIRLALQVDDSLATAERLAAAGADILGDGPVVTPWNDRNVRLSGPDGLQLTVFSPTD
jgi:tRNA(Arg) A34 adenosine deaminase TadA/catechol 2,3-dioxygenase-like lactoylglutathione lyase family enzyme